jgi:hypothetical protein
LECPSRSVHDFIFFSSGIPVPPPAPVDVSASTHACRKWSCDPPASSADSRDHTDYKPGMARRHRHSDRHPHECLLLPRVYRYGPRTPTAPRRIQRTQIARSYQRVLSHVRSARSRCALCMKTLQVSDYGRLRLNSLAAAGHYAPQRSGGACIKLRRFAGARQLRPAASLRRVAYADRGRDRGPGKLADGRVLLIAARKRSMPRRRLSRSNLTIRGRRAGGAGGRGRTLPFKASAYK